MWKHKNFINLQLCAGPIPFEVSVNGATFSIQRLSDSMVAGEETWSYNASINTDTYSISGNTVVWNDGTILQYNGVDVLPTDDIIGIPGNPGIYTTRSATPTFTFKHFYDAGTIGSGTVKFRHYSQQEPSSGNVIKAGTYKWVDTPDIQGITDITGEDGGIDGQFKSSDINFDFFGFSAQWNRIMYDPRENFSSLIENEEVDECGYLAGQWGIKPKYGDTAIVVVLTLQTFIVLEDIDLTSVWNDAEIEQAILSWFTANTTKLS